VGLRNFLRHVDVPAPEEPNPLEVEAREALPDIESLKGHPGWALIRGWCVEEVNQSIGEWTKGIPHERQLMLSSRVATLGWVLDLLESKQKLYRGILEAVGGLDNPENDEGTTPFIDPHERIEEV